MAALDINPVLKLICRGVVKKAWSDASEAEREKCRKIVSEIKAIEEWRENNKAK